jgi:dTDP-glucose 4,6-dehydratase
VTRAWLSGAGGFVGHHCLEYWLGRTDWDFTVTDSFRHHGKTDRIAAATRIPGYRERVTVVTHDLQVPFSEQAVQAASRVDYMVAMASESHVDRSLADPVPFAMNNVAVALNTLELARRLQPRALVLFSTDEVYGPVHGIATRDEWSPAVPSNPYAASKAAQEAFAVSYWRSFGVPVVIVNAMNILGERQAAEKYLPRLVRAVSRGETVRVHTGPGGIGSRSYVHAGNVADAILFILRDTKTAAFPEADRPSRYNLAGQERISNLELAEMVAAVLGRPLRYELADSGRPGYDQHYGLAADKLTGLGWKPPVSLREGIERAVRWTAAHPEWMIE